MLVTIPNNRMYDSRNFDSYKNYYAILKKETTIEINRQKDKDDYEKINIKYDVVQTLLVYTNDLKDSKNYQNGYKIIYGHFYNDQNNFLFKKVENGKIIGYKVHRCTKADLWRNKLDQLYISNYFGDIKKTAVLLNTKLNEEYRTNLQPITLHYEYYGDENEIVFAESFYGFFDCEYDDETLQLTAISNKIKII